MLIAYKNLRAKTELFAIIFWEFIIVGSHSTFKRFNRFGAFFEPMQDG